MHKHDVVCKRRERYSATKHDEIMWLTASYKELWIIIFNELILKKERDHGVSLVHPPALGPSPSGALSLWPALLSVPCGVDKPGSLCPLPPHTTESRNPTLTPPGLPETEPQTETRNRDLRSGGPARKTGSKPWALLTARETPWLSMPRACGLNKGFPLRQGHVQLCLPDTLPNPTGLTDLHRDTLREFPRGFREAVGPGHLLLGTPGPGL